MTDAPPPPAAPADRESPAMPPPRPPVPPVAKRRAGPGRWLLRIATGLLVLLLVLVGALWLVASQPAALRWIAAEAQQRLGGRLVLDGVDGTLLGPISIGTVRWTSDGVTVTARDARFDWQPAALLQRLARIDQLEAARIEVDLTAPAEPAPKSSTPIRLPARIELPVAVSIGRIAAGDVVVRQDGTERVRVNDFEAVATAGPDEIELTGLGARIQAAGQTVTVGGEASVRPAEPYPTRARLQARMDLEGKPLRADLRADGQLAQLDTRLTADWADAKVAIRTLVHALDPRPLRDLKVDIANLDLARVGSGLPQTDIAAKLEAELFPAWADRPDPPLLVGPLEITNQLPGPIDVERLPVARISTMTSLTGDRIDLRDLQISGPAGRIDGQLQWAPTGFSATARSDGIRLAAIQRSLQPRTVAVEADVRSDRPIAEKSIDFDLTARDGEVRADANGQLRGDWLDLKQAGVSLAAITTGAHKAPAGRARFAGRVRTVPPYDVDLSGTVRDLEPQRLVQMPPARFNGDVAIRGAVGGPGRPPGRIDVELGLTDSRFDALPLTGQARAAVHLHEFAPRSLTGVDASLRWGDASATIRGGLGEPATALDLAVAVPALKPWLAGAEGAVKGQARLHGALTAPVVDVVDLVATKLSVPAGAQRLTADRVAVNGRHLQADLAAPLDLKVDAQALRVGPAASRRRADALVDLTTLVAEVSGTPAAHKIDIRGDGRRQALKLLANGRALAGAHTNAAPRAVGEIEGWAGEVQQFEVRDPHLVMPSGPLSLADVEAASTPDTIDAIAAAQVKATTQGSSAGAAPAATSAATPAATPAATTRPATGPDAGRLRAAGPFTIRYAEKPPGSKRRADGGRSEVPAVLEVVGARLLLQGASLQIDKLDWAGGRLDAALQASAIPAYWITRFTPIEALYLEQARQDEAMAPARAAGLAVPKRPTDYLTIGMTASFNGLVADTTAEDWVARFSVQRERGDLFLTMPSTPEGYVAAGLERFMLDGQLDKRQLAVRLDIDGSTIGTVNGQIESTLASGPGDFWAEPKLDRSPLGGRLGMSMRSLRWVSPLVGDAWRLDGALAANLTFDGSLAAPRFNGAITGADLSGDDQETGMRLHDGVLAAEFAGNQVNVRLLRFLSGDGSVSMEGLLQVPTAGAKSQAKIVIDRLPIPLGAAQRVVVSGNATAELQERALSVTGKVVADEGVIELTNNNAPKLSADVVIVDPRGRQIDARDRKTVVAEAPRRRRGPNDPAGAAGPATGSGADAGPAASTGSGTGPGKGTAASTGTAAGTGTAASTGTAAGTGTAAPNEAGANAASAASPTGASGTAGSTAGAGASPAPRRGATAKPAPEPFRIYTNLVVDLGDHFRVFGSGVNARLTGAITISGVLPDQPTAKGVVKIVDGTYQIYGRRLDITEGEIRFNGPIDNPSLYIIAVRRYLQVEPRVEITGTASNPVVKLTSDPEVSDAEKLSWLILGTGLDDAQGAGQLLVLQAAADQLFGSEDSKYSESLTERFGIDMLSVKDDSSQTNAAGESIGTVVSVGKRLSNRLFVVYEQSLRGVWNIVKLQYDITNRLSLNIQTGSDSAADLLWHYPFD